VSSCEYAGEQAQTTTRSASPVLRSRWTSPERDHCAVAGLDPSLLVADAEAQEELVDRLLDRLPVDRSG
jgi:hypothetical protein